MILKVTVTGPYVIGQKCSRNLVADNLNNRNWVRKKSLKEKE